MTFHQSQRGSVIIYAMLTMSSMLAIGLTLTGLFVGKLKSAANARNSTVAIYTADSAVERCLAEARSGAAMPKMKLLDGSDFVIINRANGADITNDCSVLGKDSFSFRATGIYRGIRRSLEISQ